MPNSPLLGMERKQGKSKMADILALSPTQGQGVVVENSESQPLSLNTTPTATTSKHSRKTLRNLDFPILRLQASLLAGSIGEWQVVEGTRVKSETIILTQPSGKKYKAIRIFLAIDETDLEVVESADGIDFAVNGERVKIVE